MVKILSIIPYTIFPARTGGQRGIAIFNEYLAKETELISVTVKSNDPSYAKGYTVYNILSDAAFRYINPFYFFSVRQLIYRRRITHLLLEHPYYGWLGMLLKHTTGVKLAVHSHNIESVRWKSLGKWWWKILWWYERATHRLADYNFFIQDADREYAIRQFGLSPSRCLTVTYGIECNRIPDAAVVHTAMQQIRQLHQIPEQACVLLFTGAFNYKPNADALQRIVDTIDPLLQQQRNFLYRIIICGKDIPAHLLSTKNPNLIMAGFVEDIAMYYQGADVFINPITEGGGIKTKLVEALGYNLNAVSTGNGAIGVDPAWCNGKLLVNTSSGWPAFAALVVQAAALRADIPPVYFEHFYWRNTIKKAVAFIS